MADNSGWIKLHRKIRESAIWKGEKFSRGQAWADLLLRARWGDEPTYLVHRGVKVDVHRGQIAVSEDSLAKEWKWSRGKVRRFLAQIGQGDEQRIVQQKNNVITLITIINYDQYQSDDTADSTASSTPNGTTNGTLNKKDKKDKKKTAFAVDDFLSLFPSGWIGGPAELALREWYDHRKEIKHPLTPTAGKRQAKECIEHGPASTVAAIEKAISRGWRGLFFDEQENNTEDWRD